MRSGGLLRLFQSRLLAIYLQDRQGALLSAVVQTQGGKELLLKGEISPGIAIDNSVAVHSVDSEIHSIVASRAESKAYLVRATNGSVK